MDNDEFLENRVIASTLEKMQFSKVYLGSTRTLFELKKKTNPADVASRMLTSCTWTSEFQLCFSLDLQTSSRCRWKAQEGYTMVIDETCDTSSFRYRTSEAEKQRSWRLQHWGWAKRGDKDRSSRTDESGRMIDSRSWIDGREILGLRAGSCVVSSQQCRSGGLIWGLPVQNFVSQTYRKGKKW